MKLETRKLGPLRDRLEVDAWDAMGETECLGCVAEGAEPADA